MTEQLLGRLREKGTQICVDVGRWLGNFLWPPSCVICGAATQGPVGSFCSKCFSKLRRICAPFCHCCGEPLAYEALGRKIGADKLLCVTCQLHPPSWQEARAAFVYDSASRKLILPLKYSDRLENVRPLASIMRQVGADILADKPILVPVPLHPYKLWQRRYNQAALLAQDIGRLQECEVVVDGLVRTKRTQSLARLSRPEREQEMRQVIQVRPVRSPLLKNRRVVLVDDVLTTGATAEACVRALHAIGCKEVDVLVAARALSCERPFGQGTLFQKEESYGES